MYANHVSLIGFLGQNASTYTANNASFTVLACHQELVQGQENRGVQGPH